MNQKVFHSIEEIRKEYFPKQVEKERWNRLTPVEKAIEMAKKSIDKIKKDIKI